VAVGDGVSSVLTYISFSTIADNSAATGGGIGILRAPSLQASVEMINNIVADNTATTGPDVSGTFTSRGYNLIGNRTASTGFTATGDQTGTTASPLDPRLDTLRNNGGVTNTYALSTGSPAIDTGTCSGFGGLVIASDQRGVSRPFGTRCDIGAFEFKTFPIVVRVVPVGTGSLCTTGGLRIDSGEDINGDNVLQDSEVRTQANVCNGLNGFNALVAVATIDVGSPECSAGGQKIQYGLDNGDGAGTARDNTLQTGEVDSTAIVCNGVKGDTGDAGFNGLVKMTTIGTGDATCPTGGQKVDSGLDNGDGGGTAGNGTLENGEVDSSANVCNGAEALVTVTPIDTGDAQCPAGGQTLKVGIDVNGDNAFGEGELPAETKICNGEKGPRGFSPVVKVTALAVGDKTCASGGTALAIGLDDGEGEGAIGENGILEDAEIDSTASVCNGGAQKVLVTRINAGAACPDGGVNITVGTDKDGNGKIEGAEIESNQNICESVGGGGGGCTADDAGAGNNATGVALTLFGLLGFAGAVAGRRRRLAVVRSDSRP